MTQALAHFLKEGPASACILHGQYLGYLNCGTLSFAMGIDKSTRGRIRLSGCQVRDETGDYYGGTTIPQNAAVAEAHGVDIEIHVGSGVVSPYYGAVQLQAGRGLTLAGNLSALIRTPYRSNGVAVNHQVWINHVRGGILGHPKEALVMDPMANGRLASWGRVVLGPQWWPWSLVLAFAAALDVRARASDPLKLLGSGKWYCGIFPDTEPFYWGSDVPADCRAVDPDGAMVAAALREIGISFGTVVNIADLKAAHRKLRHSFGTTINPGDVQWLLTWAAAHT